jgi:hypothetical protein
MNEVFVGRHARRLASKHLEPDNPVEPNHGYYM